MSCYYITLRPILSISFFIQQLNYYGITLRSRYIKTEPLNFHVHVHAHIHVGGSCMYIHTPYVCTEAKTRIRVCVCSTYPRFSIFGL